MDTSTAIITAGKITPINNAGKLLALADVTLMLDGVEITIHGVQVRADASGTEVTLPRYRSASGEWMTAITLPDELRGAMGDVVMAAGIEAGVLKEKG